MTRTQKKIIEALRIQPARQWYLSTYAIGDLRTRRSFLDKMVSEGLLRVGEHPGQPYVHTYIPADGVFETRTQVRRHFESAGRGQ